VFFLLSLGRGLRWGRGFCFRWFTDRLGLVLKLVWAGVARRRGSWLHTSCVSGFAPYEKTTAQICSRQICHFYGKRSTQENPPRYLGPADYPHSALKIGSAHPVLRSFGPALKTAAQICSWQICQGRFESTSCLIKPELYVLYNSPKFLVLRSASYKGKSKPKNKSVTFFISWKFLQITLKTYPKSTVNYKPIQGCINITKHRVC